MYLWDEALVIYRLWALRGQCQPLSCTFRAKHYVCFTSPIHPTPHAFSHRSFYPRFYPKTLVTCSLWGTDSNKNGQVFYSTSALPKTKKKKCCL